MRVTVGLGITTRNRYPLVRQVLDAISEYPPGIDMRLVVGVDHDPACADALWDCGVNVVEPQGTGVPANRNRILAELAAQPDLTYFALLDDDHVPVHSGWLRGYVGALQEGAVGVIWRLGLASGPITYRAGRVVWRERLGCPLMVMTRHAYETVGALNQVAFGSRYGLDDSEYGYRCYHAGLIGNHYGYWPCLDDGGRALADLPDPPSSDGKSAEQRADDVAANMGALKLARRGEAPIWLANPEEVR